MFYIHAVYYSCLVFVLCFVISFFLYLEFVIFSI